LDKLDTLTPQQTEVPMDDGPAISERHQQLLDDVLCTGSALALAQSLKTLAPQLAQQGSEGWAVIARRAERFVRLMHMHVTRFLMQPDCRLRHHSLDEDLLAAHVDVSDVGQVIVHCTNLDGEGWHQFPLDELFTAGPVNDMVRVMMGEMTKALVQEALGKMIEEGQLGGTETLERFKSFLDVNYTDETGARREGKLTFGVDPASPDGDEAVSVVVERTPDGGVVHHLQVHDEYILGDDTHAEPVAKAVGFEPPEGDEAFGANGS
jgi:hypothetical protein